MGVFTNSFIKGLGQQGSPAILRPTSFTSSFVIDTILGQLNWIDNEDGSAQYEVYSSTNGGAFTLLATTAAGATSYQDTTCLQNASVVYKIRAKKHSVYSDYVTASALTTPLCWKTNQSTLVAHVINNLSIAVGKTVTVNYSDGTSQSYTGNNSNIIKNFSTTGQYNVWLSGDTNFITTLSANTQTSIYGVVTDWVLPSNLASFYIHSTSLTGVVTNWVLPSNLASFYINSTSLTGVVTNWVLPSSLVNFSIHSTSLTGVVTNWVLPSSLANFYIYSTSLTGVVTNWVLPSNLASFYISSTSLEGSLPQITAHATNAMIYRAQNTNIIDSNVTVFRKAMTVFDASTPKQAFSTANLDKLLKAIADWYQNNAPTANCTFTLNGTNMGIPTGGASNADIARIASYYSAVGKTATIIVRTS